MKEKICIMTDTMVDIPKDWINVYSIKRIPTIIYFGSDKMDAREIDAHDVLEYYGKNHELPTTGPTTVEMFNDFFVPLIHQGYYIIYLSSMPSISANYSNSLEAAEIFGDKITIIDTKFSSIGVTPLIWEICNFIKDNNPTYDEIINKINTTIDKIRCQFIVDDLNFVMENSNVSFVSRVLANVMNIKPSMILSKGKILPDKKFSGNTKKALSKFIDYTFSKYSNIDTRFIVLGHTDADVSIIKEATELINKHVQFEHTEVLCAGGPISAHLGKGAIMLAFLEK